MPTFKCLFEANQQEKKQYQILILNFALGDLYVVIVHFTYFQSKKHVINILLIINKLSYIILIIVVSINDIKLINICTNSPQIFYLVTLSVLLKCNICFSISCLLLSLVIVTVCSYILLVILQFRCENLLFITSGS